MPKTLRVCIPLLVAALLVGVAPVYAAADRHGDEVRSEWQHGAIVLFRDDTISREAFTAMGAAGVPAMRVTVRDPRVAVVDLPDGVDPETFAARMTRRADVVAVAPDALMMLAATVPPDDPYYDGIAHPQRDYLGPVGSTYSANLEPVWDAVFNGDSYALNPYRAGVTLAILDTGLSVPYLEDPGEYVPVVLDYTGDISGTADDYAPTYHGTRVASIIRAEADNDYATAGALHDSPNKVFIYKTLDSAGRGYASDTMSALLDASRRGARVINVSLGDAGVVDFDGGDFTPQASRRAQWESVVSQCSTNGSLVVAASGNIKSGYTDVYYPAACTSALAVGSIDPTTGVRSSFSNYGPELDVMAAGERVWTTPPGGTPDQFIQGTSFAAPVVSGSLALLWSLVPGRSPAQMLALARNTAADLGIPGPDSEYGYGRFDAQNGYSDMTSTIAAQSPVTVSAGPPAGTDVTLSWTAAPGADVFYSYGYQGGPEYRTTATTGRLVLPSGGSHEVHVDSFASDRWGSQQPGTATVTIAGSYPSLTSRRLDGADRYDTAVAVSRESFPGGVPGVVIASGQDWPDALSSSVLANVVGGPTLLTRPNRLDAATRDELRRLQPATVYIVGGTGAVSTTAANQMALALPSASIIRLPGTDRYDTARLVANRIVALSGPPTDGTVIVASGQSYPDALSAAPWAARARYPILLTRVSSVPGPTRAFLDSGYVSDTIVVGGTGVVDDDVFAQLSSPERIYGDTRYTTSHAIATRAQSEGVLDYDELGVATGRNFPDALSAGPFLASRGGPLLLADSLDSDLAAWIAAEVPQTSTLDIFGGRAVVTYNTEWDLLVALRGP